MEEHQVIVAGAGPSGAACAKALRKAGIDVLIIEKEKLPRHKICSGVLFGQTQMLLDRYFGGLPPQDVYCTPREIPAEHIHEWNRDKGFLTYVWETGKDGQEFPLVYLNIWRSRFDHWLVQQSGAEVRENCSVRSMTQDGTQIPSVGFPERAQDDGAGCSKRTAAGACVRVSRGRRRLRLYGAGLY